MSNRVTSLDLSEHNAISHLSPITFSFYRMAHSILIPIMGLLLVMVFPLLQSFVVVSTIIILVQCSIVIRYYCFALDKTVRNQLNDTSSVEVVGAAPTPFTSSNSLPESSELYNDCVCSTFKYTYPLLCTELQMQ